MKPHEAAHLLPEHEGQLAVPQGRHSPALQAGAVAAGPGVTQHLAPQHLAPPWRPRGPLLTGCPGRTAPSLPRACFAWGVSSSQLERGAHTVAQRQLFIATLAPPPAPGAGTGKLQVELRLLGQPAQLPPGPPPLAWPADVTAGGPIGPPTETLGLAALPPVRAPCVGQAGPRPVTWP